MCVNVERQIVLTVVGTNNNCTDFNQFNQCARKEGVQTIDVASLTSLERSKECFLRGLFDGFKFNLALMTIKTFIIRFLFAAMG